MDCSFFIDICMRSEGVWTHKGAYGCVTDACECIRMHPMHMDAYYVPGTRSMCTHVHSVHNVHSVHTAHAAHAAVHTICTYCTHCTCCTEPYRTAVYRAAYFWATGINIYI